MSESNTWRLLLFRSSVILLRGKQGMVKLHRLNGNVYGVTNLYHVAGIGVNAGFVISGNSIIHIDAGMTVQDDCIF
jgi:hypothetical protein